MYATETGRIYKIDKTWFRDLGLSYPYYNCYLMVDTIIIINHLLWTFGQLGLDKVNLFYLSKKYLVLDVLTKFFFYY